MSMLDARGWSPPPADTIKADIRALEMTYDEVAARLGLNKSIVSNWVMKSKPREIRFGDWVALQVLTGRYRAVRGK